MMLSRKVLTRGIYSASRKSNLYYNKKSFASSSASSSSSVVESDGVLFTFGPDYDFWKLTTKNNEEKIRDYSVSYPTGKALSEEYFTFPETRLGKPIAVTGGNIRDENNWLARWIETGDVKQVLSELEKEKPRLSNYEVVVYGLIGHDATSAEVTAVLQHAKSRVPLTTTFLSQVLEAYVAAKDFAAAQALFDSVQTTYNLPLTLEIQHKYLGLFQLNNEYADKVEEVRDQFLQKLSEGRSRALNDVNLQELPEYDSLATDALLNVPAEKEKRIISEFLSGVTLNVPFEQGMKEWKRRMESYVDWHQNEETAAVEELKKSNAALVSQYDERNAKVFAFLEKKYGGGVTPAE